MLKIYSMKDKLAKAYGQPQFFTNDGVAMRAVISVVNSKQQDNSIAMYPEDHALYCVGEWDTIKGKITSEEPRLIVECVELKDADENEQQKLPGMD